LIYHALHAPASWLLASTLKLSRTVAAMTNASHEALHSVVRSFHNCVHCGVAYLTSPVSDSREAGSSGSRGREERCFEAGERKFLSATTRPATRVNPERLRSLDDYRLRDLMVRLLRAEGHVCRSPANGIVVSDNVKAGDGGCDGWSPAHQGRTDWLPGVDTCWQFKSGSAGEPAKLKGEVLKPIPQQTLRDGGAYVVVASQASGKSAADKRLAVLRDEASAAGLPTDRIDVYNCEKLAAWCDSIPAVGASMAGVPYGLLLFEDWARDCQLAGPFHASESVALSIAQARAGLDFGHGEVSHLHIGGQPGVGRTRLALEIVRSPGLQEFAIYCPIFNDDVVAYLGQVRNEPAARLLAVVDQIPSESVGEVHRQIGLADGRIRLITIGSEQLPDSTDVESLQLARTEQSEMREIVRRQAPGLSFEHLDFVVTFADGFVKLARIAWTALRQNPDVRGLQLLLRQNSVRAFLDRVLGGVEPEDLAALQSVALMSRLGWDGDVAHEGEAFTQFLGLNWRDVRHRVNRIHERVGIAPLAGRLRYISPRPLATLLARNALDVYGDILPRLPDQLSSDLARLSLFKRLTQLSEHSVVRSMCHRLMDRFQSLADFEQRGASQLWAQVAIADPPRAIPGLSRILEQATPSQKRAFVANGFEIIGTLEKIAWSADTFDETMVILAELAVEENEATLYKPSNVFCDRYQVALARTEVPYVARLQVLDALLLRVDPFYQNLAIRALTAALRWDQAPIIHSGSDDLRVVGPPWLPRNLQEDTQVRLEALTRVIAIAESGRAEGEQLLVKAACASVVLMERQELVSTVVRFLETIARVFPARREELRSAVSHHVEICDARRLHPAHTFRSALHEMHELIAGQSFEARLRQHTGHTRWGMTEPPSGLFSLIDEVIAQPDLIMADWAWITSGQAHNVHEFGTILGQRDVHGAVAEFIDHREARGPDLRFQAAYLKAHSSHHPPGWLDDWLEVRFSRNGADAVLVLDVTCIEADATARTASRVLSLIRAGALPLSVFNRLRSGRWAVDLPAPEFSELIGELAGHPELRSTALFLIWHRSQRHPGEIEGLEDIKLALVTNPVLLCSDQELLTWQGVARTLAYVA
jgi:hypothetical protein